MEKYQTDWQAALDKADADFLAAITSANNSAQKDLALKAHATATTATYTTYKTAAAAIGSAPR